MVYYADTNLLKGSNEVYVDTGGSIHETFLFALGLFSISAVVSVLVIYGAARYQMREEAPVPNTVIETESVNEMEGRAAANQESITPVSSRLFSRQ